jgi:hypothetical protein
MKRIDRCKKYFWLGVLTLGIFAQAISFADIREGDIFIGSATDYTAYQENLEQIANLAEEGRIDELSQKLQQIFSESTALEVQIAIAKDLADVLSSLPTESISGFSLEINNYLSTCNSEIDRIRSLQNITATDRRKLDSLYNLREVLISAVAKTNYFSAANPAEQLNKLISIIDERDPSRINSETVCWAIRKLPEVVSSSADSQLINPALQGLENSFLYDSIRYALDNTKKELEVIFAGYSQNQDRRNIDLDLLNNSSNQRIKKQAYDRLFKGSNCDDTCQSEKITFLKSGTKNARLFRDEVEEAEILLPKVTIKNSDPQGPYRENASVTFSAEVQPREGGSPIQYSWLLMDSQGNPLQSSASETATFSFPQAGFYEVGVEVRQTVNGEQLCSLMSTTSIRILSPQDLIFYTLTITPTNNGTITKSPDRDEYEAGEQVRLTATANPIYAFTGWSADLSGKVNPIDITMDTDKTITANFTRVKTNSHPKAVSVAPASLIAKVSIPYTFTATFADADGYRDIAKCYYWLINPNGSYYLRLYYDSSANKLYLLNSDGSIPANGCIPGPGAITAQNPRGILENSKVILDCSNTTVTMSGNNLTINWRITFKTVSTEAKAASIAVYDKQNAGAGLQHGWWIRIVR